MFFFSHSRITSLSTMSIKDIGNINKLYIYLYNYIISKIISLYNFFSSSGKTQPVERRHIVANLSKIYAHFTGISVFFGYNAISYLRIASTPIGWKDHLSDEEKDISNEINSLIRLWTDYLISIGYSEELYHQEKGQIKLEPNDVYLIPQYMRITTTCSDEIFISLSESDIIKFSTEISLIDKSDSIKFPTEISLRDSDVNKFTNELTS